MTLELKGEVEMIGLNATNELFPPHLRNIFRKISIEEAMQGKGRDLEIELDFVGR